eukprot:maker-scaffold809_size94238-snap-gene-0.23 protein:Tk02705 transcript:maker-scaffold809_size94238-snap-gene-0.23-mRNA-1 annotation:"peptide synthetase"
MASVARVRIQAHHDHVVILLQRWQSPFQGRRTLSHFATDIEHPGLDALHAFRHHSLWMGSGFVVPLCDIQGKILVTAGLRLQCVKGRIAATQAQPSEIALEA